MPGGIAALFQHWPTGIFGGQWGGELLSSARNLANDYPAGGGPSVAHAQAAPLAALGRYFTEHPGPPWITGSVHVWPGFFATPAGRDGPDSRPLGDMTYLGTAISLLIAAEAASQPTPPAEGARWYGPLHGLHPYILRRWGLHPEGELPVLPVPDNFRAVFRDWAAGQVDFVAPAGLS